MVARLLATLLWALPLPARARAPRRFRLMRSSTSRSPRSCRRRSSAGALQFGLVADKKPGDVKRTALPRDLVGALARGHADPGQAL